MKPALSVLIFTVSSGVGYGLLMWMIVLQLLGQQPQDLEYLMTVGGVGIVLVTLGLLSSTLHLANPKNAWRAFNRFRTSWLSREGVFAILFYPLVIAYGGLMLRAQDHLTALAIAVGLLSLVVALLTVISTGMIYASLKPIRQWHNHLTTPIYILFSLLSGVLLLAVLNVILYGEIQSLLLTCFYIVLLVSALFKMLYFWHIGKPDGATINTATGFSQAQVRLLDAGHNADTFLTNEFVFDAGALKLVRLRRIMAILVFVFPALIIAIAVYTQASYMMILSMVSLLTGLLIERWLFFAEARHVVRLYHGDQRT